MSDRYGKHLRKVLEHVASLSPGERRAVTLCPQCGGYGTLASPIGTVCRACEGTGKRC